MKVEVFIRVLRDDGVKCGGEMHFDTADHDSLDDVPLTDMEVAAHVAAEAAIHLSELLAHDHHAPGPEGMSH